MTRALAVRLVAFVLVVGGTFGSAYGLGRRLPGNPESRPHTHGAPAKSLIPPGFEVDGYVLVTDAAPPQPSTLSLHIDAPDGTRVTQFEQMNAAVLDVVTIRPDLSGFRHVRPDVASNGSFVVPMDGPGKWHVVVDVHPAGAARPITMSTNTDDEIAVAAAPLPKQETKATVDGFDVVRDGSKFTIAAPAGVAVTEPAEVFAFHEGDLAYVHDQPANISGATFTFGTTFPAGKNRVFFEFTAGAAAHIAAFTVIAR